MDRDFQDEREESDGVVDGQGEALGELCSVNPGHPVCSLLMEADSSPSFVRVKNASDQPYDNVELTWPEVSWSFGAVPPGGHSDYAEVPQGYNYAATRIRTSDGFYLFAPTDFAGEGIEDPGYFTYELMLDWQGKTVFRPIDGVPVVGFVDLELVVDHSLD